MGDRRICAYPPSDAGPVLLFDLDELIFAGTETDLFGVSDAGTPIGVGVRDAEGIMSLITVQVLVLMPHLLRALGKHGVRKRGLSHCRVGTSLVYGHGVEARKHADVVDDRRIVFGMAVAVPRV